MKLKSSVFSYYYFGQRVKGKLRKLQSKHESQESGDWGASVYYSIIMNKMQLSLSLYLCLSLSLLPYSASSFCRQCPCWRSLLLSLLMHICLVPPAISPRNSMIKASGWGCRRRGSGCTSSFSRLHFFVFFVVVVPLAGLTKRQHGKLHCWFSFSSLSCLFECCSPHLPHPSL